MSWTCSDLAAMQKRILASNARRLRTNLTNTGGAAQKLFEMAAATYEQQGLLMLRKTDPPVRHVRGRVIFLDNPWLDYAGCWAERGGPMLCLEVKSTVKTRLDLSDVQRGSVMKWELFGAVVAVIWYRFDQCRIAFPKHFHTRNPKWVELDEVKPGVGRVVFDWLGNLRRMIL